MQEQLILTIKDKSKINILIDLVKELDFVEVQRKKITAAVKAKQKAKKNFTLSAGIWENSNITAEQLRKKSWPHYR